MKKVFCRFYYLFATVLRQKWVIGYALANSQISVTLFLFFLGKYSLAPSTYIKIFGVNLVFDL